ncbi:MAG: sorting and assembly machinery component 50 [Chlorobium sp.]|nr:MAG: sorting and assembly machinery component 50 [Chlorobium sp.]
MAKALILIALIVFCAFAVHGETAGERKEQSVQPAYVNNIRFIGNKAISSEELRLIIGTSKSKSFLGLGLFGKLPRPFSPEEFAKDIFLIKKLYTYKGYFGADVTHSIIRRNNGKRLDLEVLVRENEPSRVDSLSYRGLDKVTSDLHDEYLKQKRLNIKDIFSVERLIEERDRTVSFFKEYGFSFFHEDSIRIKVDTVGTHTGISFQLNLPERLHYGPINAVVQNPVKNAGMAGQKIFTQDNISGKILGKQRVSPDLITTAIAFRPGNFTRESLEQRTLQNFGATNIFSSIYITHDSTRAGALYTTINLETAPKHQIEPKILIDNRYGPPFFGTSLAYENKNLFGGGEKLRISTEYGTQASSDNRVLANLDPSQYTKIIPYEFSMKSNLIFPVLKKTGSFYSTTAEYSATRQPVLLSSKKGLIRTTYSAPLSPSSRLNFDFFEIEWVAKDSLRGFKQLFKTDLAKNIKINPANQPAVNAAVDSLMNTHFNQGFRLRFNAANRQNLLPEKSSWKLDLLLEEAGSIAWLIDTYIDTKKYGGFSETDPQIFGTTYSQYIKFETGLALTKHVAPESQLAAKGRIGWMIPYGKAESTPEERRFYAGGSNSMRGWLFNTLGPGNSTSKAASNFGADVKLELNLEYRVKFFKLFNHSSGVTFFTDVGNIWDRNGTYALTPSSLTRDFALDSGVGLRLGSPIGPFRFDFAYKLHDPTAAKPWRISNMNIGDCTFHFGIGEAF